MNLIDLKLYQKISLCIGALFLFSFCKLYSQNVFIPDANFKNELVGNPLINTNLDAEIQVSEAIAFTGYMDVIAQGINDLTGIEAFVNLTGLNCSANSLDTLDVTSNVALVDLRCVGNNLTGIEISYCPNLKKLYCWNNNITSINFADNPNIDTVDCSYNLIGSLDLDANQDLKYIDCSFNQISTLDLSNNQLLTAIGCSNNMLSSLNIQNGNNINLTYFNAINNPNGLCVKVDDVTQMTNDWPNNIDVGSNYSVTCGPCTINIPDANFKNALLNNSTINTNGNGEIECSEAAAYNGVIFVQGSNISDLTGIESFTNITQLNCSSNQINSVDLSALTSVNFINFQSNNLTAIVLPVSTSLNEVLVANNQLGSIDLNGISYLTYLDCANNLLSSLMVNTNNNLQYLFCDNNSINDLDLINNSALIQLGCTYNQLSNINLQNGNNNNLTFFDAKFNLPLTCVQVDDVAFMNANFAGSIDAGANYNTSCSACVVSIPDVNFKNALLANPYINTNSDNEIQCAEAAAFTGYLNVQLSNIADLTGIEAFISIDSLNCSSNQLTNLNLSSNTELIFIQCFGNQLSSLNISGLANLQVLYCYLNNITSLDLSTNSSLIVLNCNANQLSNLNTSANPNLISIGCGSNQLTSINVSANPLLTTFGCNNNQISSLNLQNNPLIGTLGCDNNNISYLDLSNLTQLDDLGASNNQLTYLNIQNGNNINFQDFDVTGNPNLTCIQVDDVNFMNNNFLPYIDVTASFSTACAACVINIPDAIFKNALLNNPAINTNANAEIECTEAANYTDTIYVANLGINSLAGIEGFLNITGLVCNLNNLDTLDLSSNTELLFVHCYDNQINFLNVYNCTQLNKLWCSNNNMDYIDVSNNYLLEEFACFNNNFTSIDVSSNTALRDFRCSFNQLTSVDLMYNPMIELLYCGNNIINSLDLSYNSLLVELDCGPNQLTNLDLSANLNLEILEAGNNNLTSLDLSNNPSMTVIYCNLNELTALNIQNGNNNNLNGFSALNNPNLTCIQVDDATFMNNNWSNAKPAAASYSVNCSSGNCPPIPINFAAGSTLITNSPMNASFSNSTPNLSNYNFVWYFGDGTMLQSSAANVNHTYYFNGIYSVSLVAIDLSNGCTDTLVMNNYITCSGTTANSCNHTVSTNPTGIVNACIGSIVPINSNTNLSNAIYQWNRNGVIISGASQPEYYATQDGNYTLTVFNAQGCPITSTVVQINYNLPSSLAPTITATGNPGPCGNVNMVLTANGSFTNYLWSNGQTGNSINVTQGGTYTVTGQSPACDAVSLPFDIVGSNAPVPPICMVTVDENDNKNIIIWEKPVTTAIDSFIVLREEINAPGIFTQVGTLGYLELSEFKDFSSDANERAYRYKLAVKDTCEGITIPSTEQRSMHLDVAQGNSVLARSLNWNVYQGQPQAYTHYLIYRETAPGNLNLQLIDSVASSQTWYIDNSLSNLNDTLRAYMIAYRITSPCVSSRAVNQLCQSNVTSAEFVVVDGINNIRKNDFDFNIYPNPSNGLFNILLMNTNNYKQWQVKAINVIGENTYQKSFIENKNLVIDLTNLAPGIYTIEVNNGVNSMQKRVAISK
ncbi:MAG TPA: PKD domain-containing protein [Bacteroidia bacterium]|nr:PKD domain-containing protein [Bacteroidia bacterium]